MDKYIKVKVVTSKGNRFLKYRPVTVTNYNDYICDLYCPYNKICDKIRNPENPENQEESFLDFCAKIGCANDDGNEKESAAAVPVSGTIEENLTDILGDIYQEVLKTDKLIKLSEVIESVCSDWCDLYVPDHSNCKSCNKMCILNKLLLKNGK